MSAGNDLPLDRPLTKGALFLLGCGTICIIFFFYVFAVSSLLLLLILLSVELVLALALARFGLATIMTRCMERHVALLPIFFRSFLLGKGLETRIALSQEDAPKLFAMLQKVCEKAKVTFPGEVLLEMNAGAWVRLRGYRRGVGKTT